MFKVRVIPCLDVKDGRVVKGVNFVDLRDAGDPVEAAIAYDAAGADELCFLDITATHENRGTMLDVVRRTAEACFMPVTVGGGVRTVDDIRVLLRSGADKVSINSAAVSRREFVKEGVAMPTTREYFYEGLELATGHPDLITSGPSGATTDNSPRFSFSSRKRPASALVWAISSS